jgi:hypothetical protein
MAGKQSHGLWPWFFTEFSPDVRIRTSDLFIAVAAEGVLSRLL